MTYKHGVYASEVPTSILPPRRVGASMPVVLGTAEQGVLNEPFIAYTYKEAVDEFGYNDD